MRRNHAAHSGTSLTDRAASSAVARPVHTTTPRSEHDVPVKLATERGRPALA